LSRLLEIVRFLFVFPANAGIHNTPKPSGIGSVRAYTAEKCCILAEVNYYYVYILASKPYGTLYIGVTNDLVRRVWEHKNDFVEGFTKKYGVHRLVYYEQCGEAESAITREKQMKKWKRQWKIELIMKDNPGWKDLYPEIARV
jgi:putative endonuclease